MANDTEQVRQLIADGLFDGASDWWESPGASALIDMVRVPGLVVALAGLIGVLRNGENPEWVIGPDHERPEIAVAVAMEWIDAGVDPLELGPWLTAGCWSAEAARRLVGVGIHPVRLLDREGEPSVLVDVGPDDPIPLAQAVADQYLTADQAARFLFARAGHHGVP